MAMSENSAFGFSNREEVSINKTREDAQPVIGKHNPGVPNTSDFKPFLFKTVEELSEVKSTQFWKNDKVRVLGKLFIENKNCVITGKLVSPLNANKEWLINVDMDFVGCKYTRGNLVEVFGYFDVDLKKKPQLKAVHIIPANGINIQSHYKVIELRNKYVPEFNA